MAPAKIVSDFSVPEDVPESHHTEATGPTKNLFSLAGQTIVITGGGRGLGITLAVAVVEAGGHAACLDLLDEPSASEWSSLQKLAKRSRLTATYDRCDITDEEQTSRLLDDIAARGDAMAAPFSGIVACAGIQQKIPAVDYPV